MWPWNNRVKPMESLKPGICECGHSRCTHANGRGECSVKYGPSKEHKGYTLACACTIYIRAKDEGDLDPETPTPSELEKLYRQ